MIVCRQLAALFCAVLFFTCGCSRSDDTPLVPESDDSNYKHGKQLQRHGRNGEALNAFLKVIETRGGRSAPESHLEAGIIYLHHSKNPIEAIYHFNRYLEVRPNSPQAPYVRDLINTATREFALRLPTRPFDDQSVRLTENKELEKLRRENEELRAEMATLRGGGGLPVNRLTKPIVNPDDTRMRISAAPGPVDSPISVAPSATLRPADQTDPTRSRATSAGTPPARPSAGKGAVASGRVHTVAPKESLWSIARRYYGDPPSAARVNAIYEANRDVMSHPTDLKIGMMLRIP
jgi:hypothetical protein